MKSVHRYSCEEVFRRLDDYVDRELSDDEVRRVERHLATCTECASEARFEAVLLSELKDKLDRIRMPPNLLTDIVATMNRVGSLEGAARRDPRQPT